MSYHTECDWCGAWLRHEDDQAVMAVTIKHRAGRGTLEATWAEETRQTRHFCAAPREDTDHTGTNRMGLVPEQQFDSCYDRAIAAITGTELGDPGMGMEWRLVPVGESEPAPRAEPPQQEGERQKRIDGLREPRAVWQRLGPAVREALLLQVLGDQRLIMRELTWRLNKELGCERALYESDVSSLVRRMFQAGKLEREAETFNKTHTRYRYFCTRAEGPIAEPARREAVA